MKQYRAVFSALLALFLLGCAPVLRKDIIDTAIREFSISDLQQNPGVYQEKLFVLGGIIIETKATAEGSLIEAIYVPVNKRGYLTGVATTHFRVLALFPKESGFIDPVIFGPDREITFAGEFGGLRRGKIDEMEYSYPFFTIRQIYLWKEREEYYYYYPYYYDPLWGDYPYWWRGRPYWWQHRPPYPYWW